MNSLNLLNGWAGIREYSAPRSAQGCLQPNQAVLALSCGSFCGSDDGDPKPSACGTGDALQPSDCGAGDDSPPKPSACGSSCGSGEK